MSAQAHHPHDPVAAAKRIHREQSRAARCALDPATCMEAAIQASRRLLELPELAEVRVVLAYAATDEEIDPAPALDVLRDRGVLVALPRVEAPGVLGLHLNDGNAELEEGPFGILQPTDAAPRVPPEVIDAVIVPGVAFDLEGRRLGYGGGYYDRLLGRLRPDCIRMGFAYDEQLAEVLPFAEHDEHVHVVVTPSRVLKAPGS